MTPTSRAGQLPRGIIDTSTTDGDKPAARD